MSGARKQKIARKLLTRKDEQNKSCERWLRTAMGFKLLMNIFTESEREAKAADTFFSSFGPTFASFVCVFSACRSLLVIRFSRRQPSLASVANEKWTNAD